MASIIVASFEFSRLSEAPLIIDAIYKGGSAKNMGDDPLSKLLPRTENMGGFRKTRMAGTDRYAYIVIYTTATELEWPDFLDMETGIFRYYGDNRRPGHQIHDTAKGGNRLLSEVFKDYNDPERRFRVPPFLIFSKVERRDVKFLGLAVPGNPALSSDQELVSFWRTIRGERFQNYEAYFTVLDTKGESISKEWLSERVKGDSDCDRLAPSAWKNYIAKGKSGISALKSERVDPPSRSVQLPHDDDGRKVLSAIRDRYSDFPQEFEGCAVKIVQMMDINFVEFDLTRPWRDGGRDAVGVYRVGIENNACPPLKIQCALEAKLFAEDTGVTVRHMSRLISRIKYREFGVFITTSYIASQAYKEVHEDGHPILMITGKDIADILRRKGINSLNINEWLSGVEYEYTYYADPSEQSVECEQI